MSPYNLQSSPIFCLKYNVLMLDCTVSDEKTELSIRGHYGLVFGFFSLQMVSLLFKSIVSTLDMEMTKLWKAMLISAIFKKSFRLSLRAKFEFSSGKVLSFDADYQSCEPRC
jgi:hypothetical protein